jgi:pimeloyl-ACP methyl ester carboxylesterase
MPRIELNGLRFHYQQTGEGPDVVLVHAFTANMAVWMFSNIVPALSDRFRVTTYDLRGHGHTAAPRSGYDSATMAADWKQLADALDLAPAFLVGHSFGGVIALHAAALFPDSVRGVVLSDSYFPGLADIEPNMADANVWADLRQTFGAAGVELGERVDFTRLFRTIAGLTAEQHERIAAAIGPAGARWMSQLGHLAETTAGEEMFAVAGLDAERISSITQPVYALYDEHSPFLATCRYLEQNLPACTVAFVPGAKHVAPLQNSPAFVDLVSEWLRAQTETAS